jgi:hypothetical protein
VWSDFLIMMAKKTYTAATIFLAIFAFELAFSSLTGYGFDLILSTLLSALISLVTTMLAMSYVNVK